VIAKIIDPLINQVSRININCQSQRGPDDFPFGGRKFSAEGTLSKNDALKAFSTRSLVAIKVTSVNKKIIADILDGNKSQFLSTKQIL
jgi:glyceraldehyde-3-phosphate dehydrogenase (NADP+)